MKFERHVIAYLGEHDVSERGEHFGLTILVPMDRRKVARWKRRLRVRAERRGATWAFAYKPTHYDQPL